jgi:methylmalonyl-CoA mutase C-terminal domain/subunit
MEKIKIFIGTLGMDQHELGAIAVARLLRDAGMEVLYMGRFNLPPKIVKVCMEEDVDVVGLSCHSWEYLYYLPDLLELMKEQGVDVPVVVGGSVITPGDSKRLEEMGIAAVFGPGAPDEQIIETIRKIV